MKKKQMANLVMVAVIVVIAAAGILGAGHILGWFDSGEGAVLTDRVGVITLHRDGVSFTADEDTTLRPGDRITLGAGAKARIQVGSSYLMLGDRAALTVTDSAPEHFRAAVEGGEVFCSSAENMILHVEENELPLTNTIALFSVRAGAQSVGVLAGTVLDAHAGQQLQWVNGEKSVSSLSIESLNSFAIYCIRGSENSGALCFTPADLDQLEADRLAAQQQELEDLLNPTKPSPEATDPADPTAGTTVPQQTGPTETTGPEQTTSPTTRPEETDPPVTTHPEQTTPPVTQTNPPATQTEPPVTTAPEPPKNNTCTITIRCDTILNNMDDLDPDKVEFVPDDGIILHPVKVSFSQGETVFDVLRRACEAAGIQLEYSWTPMYDSYYVEGINNLYEFDCGGQSGWMYKVNGWFPNYGCSSYQLKDGDHIVWSYTCKGLGADVGAPAW